MTGFNYCGNNSKLSLGDSYTDRYEAGYIPVIPKPEDFMQYERKLKLHKAKKWLINALRRFCHGSR